MLNRLSIKPDLILVDEAIKTIYTGGDIDFRRMKRQDLPALTKRLAENANARFGGKLVREVFVEELNDVSNDQGGRSLIQEAGASSWESALKVRVKPRLAGLDPPTARQRLSNLWLGRHFAPSARLIELGHPRLLSATAGVVQSPNRAA